jgi:predicted NACHT family NTPase
MERMGRSLSASAAGLLKANRAALQFARKSDLAAELAISRSTLQKFFAGKPIARENFHQICDRLGLAWREIAAFQEDEPPDENPELDKPQDIEALVQLLRQQGQATIQAQFGMIRILDMSQPLALLEVYASADIWEKMSGRRRLSVDEFRQSTQSELDRLLLNRSYEATRMPALEIATQVEKLIVLGGPGAGKTTFLKFLALQCSLGNFQANSLPVFVSLKNFAESSEQANLLAYIANQFEDYGIKLLQVTDQLLQAGRLLLLFDGLDEVKAQDQKRVIQEIQRISLQFSRNPIIITCRIGSQNYTFEQFTEVEIAAFSDQQIRSFVRSWFQPRSLTQRAAIDRTSCCLEKLFLSSNLPIRELATSPLLLTLLCLVFEDRGDFPNNRSDLYREGLDILLKQWDTKRNIERQSIDQRFSLLDRIALLSRLAWVTFERGDYFFDQREVEQQFQTYFATQPELNLSGETVLKSIEAQHGLLVERARGVYSFSHLTFHEYFAAYEITNRKDFDDLVQHLTESRWREIFLLAVEMSENPNELLQLMKARIDQLAIADPQLQDFLCWLHHKSISVTADLAKSVLCAFYMDLEVVRNFKQANRLLDLARALQPNLMRLLSADLVLDLALDRLLMFIDYVEAVEQPYLALQRVIHRAIARAVEKPKLARALDRFKAELPEELSFDSWWKRNGHIWSEQLRNTLISERNIGYQRSFESLKQYYDACCLFADCINSIERRNIDGSELKSKILLQ